MPHFCELCGSLLVANTRAGLQMECRHCARLVPPRPDDFRRLHAQLAAVDERLKYDIMLENAPHDPAGKLVRRACPACGEPLLTLVYVGEAMLPIFCCICGALHSLEHLERAEEGAKASSADTASARDDSDPKEV